MTGLETHGITHLSASSLNAYAAQPALWVMERLLGFRSPASATMARGKAAEAGVHIGLIDPGLCVEDCIRHAEDTYDRDMALSSDPRRAAERANLGGYVSEALAELRLYGAPTSYQERIELRLDGVPVPIIGFLDWEYGQHGMIVDLKTAEKHPASIGPGHARQGAVYAVAKGNAAMRFAYAKPAAGKNGRGVVVYELSRDDARAHLDALRQIAIRLNRFLSISSDPHELAGLICPNFEHWMWSNPSTRACGKDIYGW